MSAPVRQAKRTHFRGKARLERRLELAFCPADSETDEMLAAWTRNISSGGAFIAFEHPLPIGTELYIELYIPTAEEPIELDAEVRWLVPPGDDNGETGMGVEFIDLSVDSLLALNEYFASLTGTEGDD